MPFRSQDQIEKFRELVKQGKMTQEKFDQWLAETPTPNNLPQRVGSKTIKTIKETKVIK